MSTTITALQSRRHQPGHDGPGRDAFTDMNAPLVENTDNQHHSQRDPGNQIILKGDAQRQQRRQQHRPCRSR